MSELAAALREAGHSDVADALERKELAGRLRQTGRDDLANQLEGSKPPDAPAADAVPVHPEQRFAESLRDHMNSSLTRWHGDDAA